mmetsp:Transcript_6958/g.20098  ORF Transcript_6958/g.20098 Transcript_6958/m.20098 type:complete len:237 (+) Transcript_6958:810-1520(+)
MRCLSGIRTWNLRKVSMGSISMTSPPSQRSNSISAFEALRKAPGLSSRLARSVSCARVRMGSGMASTGTSLAVGSEARGRSTMSKRGTCARGSIPRPPLAVAPGRDSPGTRANASRSPSSVVTRAVPKTKLSVSSSLPRAASSTAGTQAVTGSSRLPAPATPSRPLAAGLGERSEGVSRRTPGVEQFTGAWRGATPRWMRRVASGGRAIAAVSIESSRDDAPGTENWCAMVGDSGF